MRATKKATIVELARAVLLDENLKVVASKANLERFEHVFEIGMKRIGIAALGTGIDIDLGNGHSIHCTVIRNAEPDRTSSVTTPRRRA